MAAPTAPVELVRTELPFPAFVYNLTMAGVAQTVTIPAGVSWIIGGIAWVAAAIGLSRGMRAVTRARLLGVADEA